MARYYNKTATTRGERIALDTDRANYRADWAAIEDGTYQTSTCKVEPIWYSNDGTPKTLQAKLEKRRDRIAQDRRSQPRQGVPKGYSVPMSAGKRDVTARKNDDGRRFAV